MREKKAKEGRERSGREKPEGGKEKRRKGGARRRGKQDGRGKQEGKGSRREAQGSR